MNYEEIMNEKLKEMDNKNKKDEEKLKQRWIEKWGEEHYNHTDKIVKEISKGISEILHNDNKKTD